MALAVHRTGIATSGDVEIFYRAFGRKGAMPIMIVHGLSFISYDWIAALVLVDYSPENAPEGSNRVATTVAGVPDRFASIGEAMAYFGADADAPADAPVRLRYEAYLKPVDGGYIVKRDDFHRDRFRQTLAGAPAAAGPDMWGALAKAACPILGVRGLGSDMFAPETAERVKSANENLTLVEVEAGHDVGGDNPEALLAEIGKFLNGLE